MPSNPNQSGKGFRPPAIQRLGRKASNGARKLSYSSSQLETPTLTSERYFSSPISNQHNSISNFIPSRRGFRKAHLNINSLTKHIDELGILLFIILSILSQLMKLNLMTLSKAVRSIYQTMNLFLVIETDKAWEEAFI